MLLLNPKNRSACVSITKLVVVLIISLLILFSALLAALAQVFTTERRVLYGLLSIGCITMMIFILYWSHQNYKRIKMTKYKSIEIFAVSKDGYDTELTRLESKRNFSNFLETYMSLEVAAVKDDDEFWWYKHTSRTKKDLKDRFQKFISQVYDTTDNFQYEGIFDKKEEPKSNVQIKLEKFYQSGKPGLMKDMYSAPSPISEISNKTKVMSRIVKKNSFVSTIGKRGKNRMKPEYDQHKSFSSSIVKSKSMVPNASGVGKQRNSVMADLKAFGNSAASGN